jgi:hypothetical protein
VVLLLELLLRIHEVVGSNPGPETSYRGGFRGFPSSL